MGMANAHGRVFQVDDNLCRACLRRNERSSPKQKADRQEGRDEKIYREATFQ